MTSVHDTGLGKAALDFSHEIAELTERFVGREWLLNDVRAWAGASSERFLILTGEPGIGKSAAVAKLVASWEEPNAYHFSVNGRGSTLSARTFLKSIVAQLVLRLPGFADALAQNIKDQSSLNKVRADIKVSVETNEGQIIGAYFDKYVTTDIWEEAEVILRAPLCSLDPPSFPVVVFVDSLDEALAHSATPSIVQLLANLRDLPPWVKFVCSSREGVGLETIFEASGCSFVPLGGIQNRTDLWAFVEQRAEGPALKSRLDAAGVDVTQFVSRVAELGQDNFLYSKLLLDALEEGDQETLDLTSLPVGLDPIYKRMLGRLKQEHWEAGFQPILGLLTVAREPLAEAELVAFTGLTSTVVRQRLRELRQLLREQRGPQDASRFSIFHQSFRDFLQEGDRSGEYWCPLAECTNALLDRLRPSSGAWADLQPNASYAWKHAINHLADASNIAEIGVTLEDLRYLARKTLQLGVATIEEDFASRRILSAPTGVGSLIERLYRQSLLLFEGLPDYSSVANTLLGRVAHVPGLESHASNLRFSVEGARLDPVTVLPDLPAPTLVRVYQGHSSNNSVVPKPNGKPRQANILCCACSPEGNVLASASNDGTVRTWCVETGQLLGVVLHGQVAVRACALGSNGTFGLSGGEDGNLRTWRCSGEELAARVANRGWVNAVDVNAAFSLGVSLGQDGSLKVWRLPELEVIATAAGGGYSCSMSLDGTIIASTTTSGGIAVWNLLLTGDSVQFVRRHVLAVEGTRAQFCALSGDGRLMIAGLEDGRLQRWLVDSGADQGKFGEHTEYQIRFSEIVGGPSFVEYPGPASRVPTAVSGCALSADGDVAVSIASGSGRIHLWDQPSGSLRASYRRGGFVNSCAIDDAGSLAFGGFDDGTLVQWETAVIENSNTPAHDGPIDDCSSSADGSLFATASRDSQVGIWDAQVGTLARMLVGHEAFATFCAITSDGERVLSGSADDSVIVWSLTTGTVIETIAANQSGVRHGAASANGEFVVTAGEDRSVKAWELSHSIDSAGNPTLIVDAQIVVGASADHIGTVGLSRDAGSILVGDYSGTVRIWDRSGGSLLMEIKAHDSMVTGCNTDPGGTLWVTTSSDGTAKAWELASFTEVGTFSHEGVPATACSLSQRGRLATVTVDGSIRVWDVGTRACLSWLRVDGNLYTCSWLGSTSRLVVAGTRGVYVFDFEDT